MVLSMELIHKIRITDELTLQLEYDITQRLTFVSLIYYDKIIVQYPISDAIAKLKEIMREIDKFKTACELVKL